METENILPTNHIESIALRLFELHESTLLSQYLGMLDSCHGDVAEAFLARLVNKAASAGETERVCSFIKLIRDEDRRKSIHDLIDFHIGRGRTRQVCFCLETFDVRLSQQQLVRLTKSAADSGNHDSFIEAYKLLDQKPTQEELMHLRVAAVKNGYIASAMWVAAAMNEHLRQDEILSMFETSVRKGDIQTARHVASMFEQFLVIP